MFPEVFQQIMTGIVGLPGFKFGLSQLWQQHKNMNRVWFLCLIRAVFSQCSWNRTSHTGVGWTDQVLGCCNVQIFESGKSQGKVTLMYSIHLENSFMLPLKVFSYTRNVIWHHCQVWIFINPHFQDTNKLLAIWTMCCLIKVTINAIMHLEFRTTFPFRKIKLVLPLTVQRKCSD